MYSLFVPQVAEHQREGDQIRPGKGHPGAGVFKDTAHQAGSGHNDTESANILPNGGLVEFKVFRFDIVNSIAQRRVEIILAVTCTTFKISTGPLIGKG